MYLRQADGGRFRRRLSPGRRRGADEARSAGCRKASQEAAAVLDDLHGALLSVPKHGARVAAAHVFISRLISFRNRQSVPSAMTLFGAHLHDSRFLHSQCVEAKRILGIIVPPPVVTGIGQRLEGIVIAVAKAPGDDASGDRLGIGNTQIDGLEQCTQDALGRYRIVLRIGRAGRQHAAVVLRPGTVDRGVEYHMPDLALPRHLRLWRRRQKCIDLAVGEHLQWVRVSNPFDVVGRIEPDIGSHHHQEKMRISIHLSDARPLALEVEHTLDAVVGDQFEAADMHTGQHFDWSAFGDQPHMRGRKVPVEVYLVMRDPVGRIRAGARRHESLRP